MAVGQPRVTRDSPREALQQVPWLQRGFFLGEICFASHLQASPRAGGLCCWHQDGLDPFPGGCKGCAVSKRICPSICLSVDVQPL